MADKLLLSTAYFPPAFYFRLIRDADIVFIEREENYLKQTYRNRCMILASNGVLSLSVPVTKGVRLKAPVKDIKIDYSKRWQQVHIRAFTSAYGRSPYFLYYSENIFSILQKKQHFLIDLNHELLQECLALLDINKCINYTSSYEPVEIQADDYRYSISPKKEQAFSAKPYIQVFGEAGFVPGLSILDLIFNLGPDAALFL
ncbi:MAG: WbqC family protein [Bacteroidales bacterium]|nr:WbqC family protein [Bacteroidales bacterium]